MTFNMTTLVKLARNSRVFEVSNAKKTIEETKAPNPKKVTSAKTFR